MKKLIYIIGGQATGKMTIGQELSKITNLKLFHNHMTVELVNHFYGFGADLAPEQKVMHGKLFAEMREGLREVVFKSIAESYLEGVIFTAVMAFDSEEDWEIVNNYKDTFINSAKEAGSETEFYVVELVCDIEERYKRNVSPHRLEQKPTKRNTEWTKNDINDTMKNYRIVSNEEDIKRFNANKYLKIDNTHLSVEEVAKKIKEEFNL